MNKTNISASKYLTGMRAVRRLGAFFLFAVSMLIPLSASADDIFGELADMKQVESVYISGRFAHSMKTWRSSTGNHALDLSQGFSSLYSYQCYSEEAVNKAKKLLKDYLRTHPEMEVVMRSKESGSEYVLYESFTEDNKLSKLIIWNSDAPNVCEIVVIDWKKGLARGTSKYSDSTSEAISPMDMELDKKVSPWEGLPELKELRNLGVLMDEESMENLGKLISGACIRKIGEIEGLESLQNLGNLSGLSELNLSDFQKGNIISPMSDTQGMEEVN